MLEDLIARAEKDNIKLAPVVGVGCPGVIREDGSIESGAQNRGGPLQSVKLHPGGDSTHQRA